MIIEIDPKNRWTLIFKNYKTSYYMAIPPTNSSRRDIIDINFKYHYDCNDNIKGIIIDIIDGNINIIENDIN